MVHWILENKEWAFSGIGVAVFGFITRFFFKKKSEGLPSQPQTQNVSINNFMGDFKKDSKTTSKILSSTKSDVKILFVDDDPTFKIVEILKNAGWESTSIVKDIEDPDSLLVRETHMFFIDIKGVALWLSPKDQGLALAAKIKEKYPEKVVVIYSSETKGDRSHEALRKVDWFLGKHAEPLEFFDAIERFTVKK